MSRGPADDQLSSELGFCVLEPSGAFDDVLTTGAADGSLGKVERVPHTSPAPSTPVARRGD